MGRSAGRFGRVSGTKCRRKRFFGFFVAWVEWAHKRMCARKRTHKIQTKRWYKRWGESGPEREIERLSVVIWIITPARRNWLLDLHYFFIDVLKLYPRSTPRQRKGRLGRIATTVVALLHEKLPRVRPESGPPPPPPALRVRGWKQSKQQQPEGHRCMPSTGQPAASVSTVSTINSGEAAQRPPVRNSPPTHLL